MNRVILIATFLCLRADAFETAQLPLSDELARTFPEISTTCYIIVNEDTNVVVTASNSEKPIDTGTFSETYDIGQLATLHKMAKEFTDTKQFFQSAMSGNGMAIRYKNKSEASFIILVYGEATSEMAQNDIEKIKAWLEQFYVYNMRQQNSYLRIPVIYGTRSVMIFKLPKTQPILLSRTQTKKIEKVYRYRTILKAPITANNEIGYVFFHTAIFKNPIQKTIKAGINIKKSGWIQCLWDSVRYLIFGATAFVQREKHR